MITFISYIIKIVLSVALSYLMIYFIYKGNKVSKEILYKQFSNASLLGSSFIGFVYIFSNNINNYMLYIIGILLFALFIFKYNKQHDDSLLGSLIFLNFILYYYDNCRIYLLCNYSCSHILLSE